MLYDIIVRFVSFISLGLTNLVFHTFGKCYSSHEFMTNFNFFAF